MKFKYFLSSKLKEKLDEQIRQVGRSTSGTTPVGIPSTFNRISVGGKNAFVPSGTAVLGNTQDPRLVVRDRQTGSMASTSFGSLSSSQRDQIRQNVLTNIQSMRQGTTSTQINASRIERKKREADAKNFVSSSPTPSSAVSSGRSIPSIQRTISTGASTATATPAATTNTSTITGIESTEAENIDTDADVQYDPKTKTAMVLNPTIPNKKAGALELGLGAIGSVGSVISNIKRGKKVTAGEMIGASKSVINFLNTFRKPSSIASPTEQPPVDSSVQQSPQQAVSTQTTPKSSGSVYNIKRTVAGQKPTSDMSGLAGSSPVSDFNVKRFAPGTKIIVPKGAFKGSGGLLGGQSINALQRNYTNSSVMMGGALKSLTLPSTPVVGNRRRLQESIKTLVLRFFKNRDQSNKA